MPRSNVLHFYLRYLAQHLEYYKHLTNIGSINFIDSRELEIKYIIQTKHKQFNYLLQKSVATVLKACFNLEFRQFL